MGRPGASSDGLSTLRITGGTISATGTGVSFNSRARGGFNFDMTGGFIGTIATRVGGSGLSAGIQGTDSTNAIDIDSDGKIYATERGLSLSHAGTGTIDVDLTSNSIIDTTGSGNRGAGLYVVRNGSGTIDVDNAGKVKSAGHDGIFVLNESDGTITIRHRSSGSIEATNNGIYVRHGNANAGGNGAVNVTSGGDITTTGTTGIFLDLDRGDATATDQIRVDLTGGTVKAAATGVFVNSKTLGGLKFDMANGASIGTTSEVVGQTGVNLRLSNTENTNVLDVGSDGAIHARWRGLSLSHAGSGDIDVDLTQNSLITTQESLITVGDRTLTRGAGVHAFHNGSGDISIDHKGSINSGIGTGIYAQQDGTGDLEIINSGMITSGFQGIEARRFSAGGLDITHRGGSITADRGPGIYARSDGARTSNKYDVNITIEGDVTTTDPNQAAVRADARGPVGNAGILVDHNAGTITGYWGIFASSARFSGSTWGGQTPASFTTPTGYLGSSQPVVLIEVGGGEGAARIVARALPGSGNEFTAAQTEHQAGWVSRSLAGVNLMPRAITVGGGDYIRVGQDIAAGDKGEAGITAEIRTQFRDVYSAALAYQGDPNAISLGSELDPRVLVAGFAGNPASNTDIDSYLNTGSNLERFREFTLSGSEKRVLKAIYGDGALETALNALPSSYTDDYKNTVRWYAGAYNDADFRVNIYNNGEVNSEGDAIRLIRRYTSDNNGASYALIEEGARVTARRYGVRMRGAGMDDSTQIPEDTNSPIPEGGTISLRKQTVEVQGHLESTGPDGAAIALRGGGYVIIGSNTTLQSASGTMIKVDEADPGINLIVDIQMKEGEDITGTFRRAVPGRIVNGGTTRAWVENMDGEFSLVPVRIVTPPRRPDPDPDPPDPEPDPEPEPDPIPPANPAGRMAQGAYDVWMDCDGTGCEMHTILAPRARVYEALPAVLLDMSIGAASSAPPGLLHGRNGTWIGAIASSANRDLKNSTANTSYDVDRIGLILGHDIDTNDGDTFGFFLHYQEGTAKVRDGGKIKASAIGLGMRHRWDQDPYFLDIKASATSFRNDLTSSQRGKLASNVSGIGYTVDMEAGYRAALREASLTSAIGAAHSVVEAEGFTDALGVEVPSNKGEETTLHVRTMLEKPTSTGVLFAGVGFQSPLDSSVRTKVGNTRLSAKSRTVVDMQGGILLGGGEPGPPVTLSLGYTKESKGDAIEAGLSLSF